MTKISLYKSTATAPRRAPLPTPRKLLVYHYAAEDAVPESLYDRTAECRVHFKPFGLWVTDLGPCSWAAWCRDQRFGLDRLAKRLKLRVAKGAKLLWLRTTQDILTFHEAYGMGDLRNFEVDWGAVASEYDGVMIFPYHGFSLHGPTLPLWYHSWDCAAGCVWNPEAAFADWKVDTTYVPLPVPEDED